MRLKEGGEFVGIEALGRPSGDGARTPTNSPGFQETRAKIIRATDPTTHVVACHPEVQLGHQMEALELRAPSEDDMAAFTPSRIPLPPSSLRSASGIGLRCYSVPPHRSPGLLNGRRDVPCGAAPEMLGREKRSIIAPSICSASSSFPMHQHVANDTAALSENHSSRSNSVDGDCASPCRAESVASAIPNFFDSMCTRVCSSRSRETGCRSNSAVKTANCIGYNFPPEQTFHEHADNGLRHRQTNQLHTRSKFQRVSKQAENKRRFFSQSQHQLAAASLPCFDELMTPVKRVECEQQKSNGVSGCLWWRTSRWLDALSTFCRFTLTFTLVSGAVGAILIFGYYLIADIQRREKQRQTKAAAEAAACRQQHVDNGCDSLDPIPPYLRGPCEEWKLCLLAVPDDHGETTKVAAQVVAQVLNSFFQTLHWRTLVAFGAFLWLAVYAYRTFHSTHTAVHTIDGRKSAQDYCHPTRARQAQGSPPAIQAEIGKSENESRDTVFWQKMLLNQLELEQQILWNQLVCGQLAKEQLELSLAKQRAIHQQMAICLHRVQLPAEYPMLQNPYQGKAVQSVNGKGMWLSFIRSPLFKFLVLLWSVAACVIGCIYAIRHKFIQL